MQTRNDYAKDVFDGDVGRVVAVASQRKELLVKVDDRIVPYAWGETGDLRRTPSCARGGAWGAVGANAGPRSLPRKTRLAPRRRRRHSDGRNRGVRRVKMDDDWLCTCPSLFHQSQLLHRSAWITAARRC
jgi:hypothetical protein